MKFTVAKEHRDYFNMNGMIEFEGLISIEKIHAANNDINRIIKERTKTANPSPAQSFAQGRDLWRKSSLLRNIDCNKHFVEIIKELFTVPAIRLGCDQLLTQVSDEFTLHKNPYYDWIKAPMSLQDISCIQGVTCGLILCLEDHQGDNSGVLSNKAGNGVFFKPNQPIDYAKLISRYPQRYVLITYCEPNSVYILQKNDPQFHVLKDIGYSYGDKLKDKYNPLLGKVR